MCPAKFVTDVPDAARYQVSIVKSRTISGVKLECSDIPGTFTLGHPALSIISTTSISRSKKNENSHLLNNVSIPYGQQILIVAEGIAKDSSGSLHVVGRGCAQDIEYNQCGVFPKGTSLPLEIDVMATAGAPCKGQTQGCEANMICLSNIVGGYCAKANCSTDGRCPPASKCISNPLSVGSCMRICTSISDCKSDTTKGQGNWDCAYRRGGDGGCYRVCVPPTWNTAYQCTP